MKGSRRLVSIVIYIFIALVLLNVLNNNIYAAVNTSYDYSTSNVSDLNNKVMNSSVLNAIGKFVYAVASIAESLVGKVFQSLTGDNMFPWSDRVIFNTIPLLDINFLNPSNGSLFLVAGKTTMLASIIRNVYFTLLSLAIGLLGIVVH